MKRVAALIALALVAVATPAQAAPWVPPVGTKWQIQFSGTLNTSVNAPVFEVDGEDTSAATVASLHAKGKKVICYFSGGTWEDWRSDAASFPASVKGAALADWPGERWLDIRKTSVLLLIMEKRIVNCKNKGFDAVDADNMDGYSNPTGLPITAANQIAYNKALAGLAHKHGLAIALKNDVGQIKELQPYFDFAQNESCVKYKECGAYAPFVVAGKAVLHIEYRSTCPAPIAGFSTMLKRSSLNAWRTPC